MLIGGNLAVAAVVLAAGLGYLYVKLRLGEINSVNIPGLTPATSGPTNILVVGSDTRSGLTDPNARSAFGAGTGATAGQRSDVTMVLHIDPNSKQASVLSIPRDLYVPIAGTNRSDRINSSFGNGPQQLIQTIQADLGIPVHHYVSMNFDGFQGLVNAVGGIDVNFPDPAKDAFSGLNITKTGCQHLDGAARPVTGQKPRLPVPRQRVVALRRRRRPGSDPPSAHLHPHPHGQGHLGGDPQPDHGQLAHQLGRARRDH